MDARAWKAALAWRAGRLARAVPGGAFHRYVLAAVPVAAMPAPNAAAGPIEAEDAVRAGLVDAAAAAWRAGQGMVCLGVHRRGLPIAAMWIGAGAFDEDEAWLTFVPPPGAAWDTGMTIAPEARGGRAFAALWGAARAWCEGAGLGWSISRIADYNLGSRRAHRRLGGVEVARVSVMRAGHWQWAAGASPAIARVGVMRPRVCPALPR